MIYQAVVRLYTNNTSDNLSLDNEQPLNKESQIEHPEAEDRILDLNTLTNLVTNIDLASTFSSLSGIFNFITSNMDVLTAIALVKHLENRAMYDPRQVSAWSDNHRDINMNISRFRESFPDFLENSAWFL